MQDKIPVTFNFNESEDIYYFIEMIFDSALTRIKQYKKLQADFESLRNADIGSVETLKLKSKILELESKLNVKDTGRSRLVGLGEAQKVLKANGFVFYKYKKPTTEVLKQRRRRRTRKEMEEAGVAIRT